MRKIERKGKVVIPTFVETQSAGAVSNKPNSSSELHGEESGNTSGYGSPTLNNYWVDLEAWPIVKNGGNIMHI